MMKEIIDTFYTNENEQLKVGTYENGIIIKNDIYEISIGNKKILNYEIEQDYILIYIDSCYYETIKEVFDIEKKEGSKYIVIKLYYDNPSNRLVKYLDNQIKENYKQEISEGYIFDQGNSWEHYIFNLNCGFENKKKSRVDVEIDNDGFSIVLCEKDYFSRLKKAHLVPNLLFCNYDNIVNAELTKNSLKILFYFDKNYAGSYSLPSKPEEVRLEVQFYATPTQEKDYFTIELYGEKEQLEKFNSKIKTEINFETAEAYLKKRKDIEEYKSKEASKTAEYTKKLIESNSFNQKKHERDSICTMLIIFGNFIIVLGCFPNCSYLILVGAIICLICGVLMFIDV